MLLTLFEILSRHIYVWIVFSHIANLLQEKLRLVDVLRHNLCDGLDLLHGEDLVND